MDEDSIIALKRGGYLHDLGKIAVPDEILKKGSDLTPAEWEVMKLHPITGENICRPLHSLRLVLPIIRHHHEHSDGSGYPDGLTGSEIPVLPRVLQVVDVYDALRTARSYKARPHPRSGCPDHARRSRPRPLGCRTGRGIFLHARAEAPGSVELAAQYSVLSLSTQLLSTQYSVLSTQTRLSLPRSRFCHPRLTIRIRASL